MSDKLSLDCVKIKTIRPGNPWAFVCFRSEDDRKKALQKINGFQWKGKSLSAHVNQFNYEIKVYYDNSAVYILLKYCNSEVL